MSSLTLNSSHGVLRAFREKVTFICLFLRPPQIPTFAFSAANHVLVSLTLRPTCVSVWLSLLQVTFLHWLEFIFLFRSCGISKFPLNLHFDSLVLLFVLVPLEIPCCLTLKYSYFFIYSKIHTKK